MKKVPAKRSFPIQKREKPTKGRSISANPLLFRATILCLGFAKIFIRLESGFAVTWASMKGRELAKNLRELFVPN